MKFFRRLYFKVFKTYRSIELKLFSYRDGDRLLKANDGKQEKDKWHLAKEEDENKQYGFVYLERRERILE